MKFKKIGEHTVECYITEEDLRDMGVSIEELVKDPNKANEFIHRIVVLSQQETDFTPTNSVLQAQIMPVKDGLMITVFDQPSEKAGESFLKNLKNRILKGLDDMSKNHTDDDIDDEGFEGVKDNADIEKYLPECDDRCYLFTSFENLMSFVKGVNAEHVLSYLYYQDKTYFMFLEPEPYFDKEYADVCVLAEEYGFLSAMNDSRIELIKEHTKPLIIKNAIETLKRTI